MNYVPLTSRRFLHPRLTMLSCVAMTILANSSVTFAQASIMVTANSKPTVLATISGSNIMYVGCHVARSYCCEVEDMYGTGPSLAYFSGPVRVFPVGTTVPSKARGLSEPTIGAYNNDPNQNMKRVCFTTATQAFHYLPIEFGLTPSDFALTCTETTLFGGFNTSVTDFNFLELTNTLSTSEDTEAIAAVVFAINSVSQQPAVTYRTVSAAPYRRTDVDIHSVVGPGAFGPMTITHDGPPGSLKAVLSQYIVTSRNPLRFIPAAQQVFTTR